MIADLGLGALAIAFLVAIYGVGAAIYGVREKEPQWVDSARNAMLLTFPLVSIVALSIITLLTTQHYEIAYVSEVTSNSMPLYLKVTALWGGQSGSLIFWSWLMSAFATAATLRKWDRDRELLPWVIVVALVTLAFFLGLSLVAQNPFARYWQIPGAAQGQDIVTAIFRPAGTIPFYPVDGNGLNPLLRHPGMIIHPPMLYLGFVSFVIPYAFAIAALISGRTDDRWIRITRRWTLVAWLFLSLGLILGARWAYDVLGWGGFWGWDPVEIAALMPWLTGTAFLHSVMIQEKRGMLKQWNMVLIILTYDLVIFGTFLTRTGVLSSVHAFAQSSIGPAFFAFIGITFTVSVALLMRRWNDLRAENEMTSMLSREALFLLNNLLFLGITVVCFWGVVYPIVSELFTGQKVTVGPPFYISATGPLFAGLLLLMGIAPLAAWRYSTSKTLGRAIWKPLLASLVMLALIIYSGVREWAALLGFWLCALVTLVTLYEFWRGALARHHIHGELLPVALWRLAGRNRRRYGGYAIHLGVVLMALGVIGMGVYQTQTQGTLQQGQEITLGSYTMKYVDLAEFDTPDKSVNVSRAVVSVYKNGRYLGDLYPRRDYYYESQQPMTIPGVRRTLEDDFYVILVDWETVSKGSATFKVYHNPLVNWLWLGGIVFIIGTLIAAWPEPEPETVPVKTRRSPYAPAKV
ncbi:MAG: heme lyase CcmF/NrfE family subunit [Omnitrophica WOR_2 bacterium]